MGRLPDQWGGRKITFRVPQTQPGELILTASQSGQQFPDATYLTNQDKPFEIHRMLPRITALDTNGVPLPTQPDQFLLMSLVRLRIIDFSKNENLTKASTLVKLFVKGTVELSWEFAEPYTLVRSEGFQILVDTTAFPVIAGLVSLRIEIAFQGFNLVVAPPSESR